MRTWQRARIAERCGRCNHQLTASDPIVVIAIPGVSGRRIRCTSCAGEEPDVDQLEAFDIAAERAIASPESQFEFTGVTKELPFDSDAAAVGGDHE